MDKTSHGAERRSSIRVKKHYIIRFSQKDNPSLKYEVSQVENISKGGLCFSSSFSFAPGTVLAIELRTPYIAETVHLEGRVLESKDKIPGILFQNRLQFQGTTAQALDILDKIEKYNTKSEN